MRGWFHPETKTWIDLSGPSAPDLILALALHPHLFRIAHAGEADNPFAVANALAREAGEPVLDPVEAAVASGWVAADLDRADPYVLAPSVPAAQACLRFMRNAGANPRNFAQVRLTTYQADLVDASATVEGHAFSAGRWHLLSVAERGLAPAPSPTL